MKSRKMITSEEKLNIVLAGIRGRKVVEISALSMKSINQYHPRTVMQ